MASVTRTYPKKPRTFVPPFLKGHGPHGWRWGACAECGYGHRAELRSDPEG